ncbi:MAG: beta-galactosidase [Clostridiales bacterium]|nr:beta-galactosidase [Clostridiales bacterium]
MAHWWNDYPWRMVQTNLREIDMADMDAATYARELKEFGATVVMLNAAGIIASYDTDLEYQTKSAYLSGDGIGEMIEVCHRNGIRVIARTDFSKVRYPIYEQHPDWAYRDKNGNILNYNGDVQCCPNGAYQQEKLLEILQEVLTRFPFDGVFCNMSGFLVVDYSGVYHGPCHCENCKRKFKEKFGLDIPEKDGPRNPDYLKYSAFKGMVLREQKKRLLETVRTISPEIAVNGVDYIRTESGTEIGVPQWQLSASSTAA